MSVVALELILDSDLKSARRSLNLLFSDWGNRGVHLWKVTLQTQALTAGSISIYNSYRL
jgi:hypothetical protein